MSETSPFIGSRRGSEALNKMRALTKPDAATPATDKDVIEWLYSVLNILDAKASGLLGVNAFFIVFLSVFLSLGGTNNAPISIPDPFVNIALVALVFFLVSSLLCFLVIRINWKFLGKVQKVPGGADYDFATEAERCANVIDDRTRYFSIAWWSTVLGFTWPVLYWFLPALPCYVGLC